MSQTQLESAQFRALPAGAILRVLLLCLLSFLAAALTAESQSFDFDLSGFSPEEEILPSGWGALSAPGYPRLPGKTLNIILPPGAKDIAYTASFGQLRSFSAPAPNINLAFSDGEEVLDDRLHEFSSPQIVYCGIGKWGEISFARFRVLPAIWTGKAWECYQNLRIDLTWSSGSLTGKLPPVLSEIGSEAVRQFFDNYEDLRRWYVLSASRSFDYLIVSTPALYAAISELETFRAGQGLATAFADIFLILANGTGNSNGEKLRNYLISEYASHPFSYLLLVGDHDTLPLLQLCPTPDGSALVPSDFFYGDLSSVMDSDGDGRLGEYYGAEGSQDWLCDYTPEVLVGRISTNDPFIAAQIAARTVAYDQSQSAWKRKALLPAAWLNFPHEPLVVFDETDGATLMEYARQTALNDWDCTTLYEQQGIMPSCPSTLPLSYANLKSQMSTNSYGLLNWNAHGSSLTSGAKYWREDSNANLMVDSGEVTHYTLVSKASFDNLANQDGLILFAASCNNGMLDTSSTNQCLAEYALAKKAVNVVAATRTGWYKPGWKNPGWGGLSSYNFLFLENLGRNQMYSGAALAWANLTHTQYFLFGDPLDDCGIIYPELQNVYTYLLFGDPAVGRSGAEAAPVAEILVYEPAFTDGLPVVRAINSSGRFNVIYTDKLIPDYDYIGNFAAVFCLFGWGDDAYALQTDSLNYALLSAYLAGGGSIYLEGDVDWDAADSFWQSFGTTVAEGTGYIENLGCAYKGQDALWAYSQDNSQTYIPQPAAASASPLFWTFNALHSDHPAAIFNSNGSYRSVASAFALRYILDGGYDLEDAMKVILDTLDVLENPAVSNANPAAPLVPQNLLVAVEDDELRLSWEPVYLNSLGQPIAVDRYLVFGSDDPLQGYALLGESSDSSFIDSGSFRRFYKVLAEKDYPQP